MDALDRIARPAADLLARVDDLLAVAGAPEEHRIWPLLRRWRALPGDAVTALVALRATPFTDAAAELRATIDRYADLPAAVSVRGTWTGPAAEAYDARRAALVAHVCDGPESVTGRLTATAEYADALADWVTAGRGLLAGTLADVLGSVEAVRVLTAADREPLATAPAAAEIGARVLATAGEVYDRADLLARSWQQRLAELPPPAAVDAPYPTGGVLRIGDR